MRMRLTVTGPAAVRMGSSFHAAAPSPPVRSSGCTASQIFFFCTLPWRAGGGACQQQQSVTAALRFRIAHLFSESGPVCGASPKRTRSPTTASAGGDS